MSYIAAVHVPIAQSYPWIGRILILTISTETTSWLHRKLVPVPIILYNVIWFLQKLYIYITSHSQNNTKVHSISWSMYCIFLFPRSSVDKLSKSSRKTTARGHVMVHVLYLLVMFCRQVLKVLQKNTLRPLSDNLKGLYWWSCQLLDFLDD
jgi:hypothetical protein